MLDDDEETWACGNIFGFGIKTGMPTEFERELTADVDVDVDMEAGVDIEAVEGGTDLDIDPTGTVWFIVVSLACLVVNGGGGGSGAKLTTLGGGSSSAPTSPLSTTASNISILAVSVIGGFASICICV
jgi:hypothetical protein